MSRRLTAAAAASAALVGAALAIAPAASAAVPASVNVSGCTLGSTITLSGTPSAGRIAVSLTVDGAAAGQYWSVAIGDNLTGVYAGLKKSDANGDVAVAASTGDQSGTDYLTGSAFNWRTGEVCGAAVSVG